MDQRRASADAGFFSHGTSLSELVEPTALFPGKRESVATRWRQVYCGSVSSKLVQRASFMRFHKTVAVVVWYSCLSCGLWLAADDNWPQWRGPALDNVSDETGLPAEFNRDKNMLWRFEMPGPGGASPVVWGDQIFITTTDGEGGLHLICVGTDGVEQWRRQLQGNDRAVRMDNANLASPSPSTDGQHVWANSGAGFLECFDMEGNPVWSVDLQQRYGEFDIQFGMTSTPILDNGRLYLQLIHGNMRDRATTSTGTVAALDAKTGDEIWQHQRNTDGRAENKHSYASPIIVRDGDREFLVTHGGDFVIGHSLDDGSELWRCGRMNPPQDYNPFLRFVASPMYRNGRLIVPSAKNGPVLCLKTDLSGDVTDNDDAFHWVLEEGTPDVSTPLLCNGLVFLTRETGIVLCIDAATGQQVFTDRLLAGKHRSSPVHADDKVLSLAAMAPFWCWLPVANSTYLPKTNSAKTPPHHRRLLTGEFIFAHPMRCTVSVYKRGRSQSHERILRMIVTSPMIGRGQYPL